MILLDLLKNILLDPTILVEWINRFLLFYKDLRFNIFGLIIYISIAYSGLLFLPFLFKNSYLKYIKSRPKGQGLALRKNIFLDFINNTKQNEQKFKIFIQAAKYMIVGGIITLCSRRLLSILFLAGSMTIENDYVSSTYLQNNTKLIDKGRMLPPEKIIENREFLSYILGILTIYILIPILIGSFFYTFSFGNKFVRNIGILFWILGIFIFLIGALLNHYTA